MNAVETAIYSRLTGDATLMGQLAGGVHKRRAPQGTSGRYLVFTKMSGVDAYTLGETPAWRDLVYLVKVVEEAQSSAAAATALARAHTVLTGSTLSVTGFTTMLTRRETDVEYDEQLAGGGIVQHVGHTYRIEVDPT